MISVKKIAAFCIVLVIFAVIVYICFISFREYGIWTLLYIPETLVLLICLYVFFPVLLFFLGYPKIRKMFMVQLPETDNEKLFFTVLIPAHNEERLLPALLESFKNQTYSKDHFQVLVVADNCNDKTAAIAELYGAHCLERFTDQPSNKQSALRYATDNFNFSPDFYNGFICVIDADCEADPDFLRHINYQLAANNKMQAMQSYRYVTNVYESNIALLDGAAEALRNWTYCASRKWIGASVFSNGSGVFFKVDLFKVLVHLPGKHLAEDKEWNGYLSEHRITVDFCPSAKLGYEAVSSNKAFQKQRRRWIGSHLAMMRDYSWKTLMQSIFNFNLMQFDCFCSLMLLPRTLLLASCLVFSLMDFLIPASSYIPHWGWIIIMSCLVLYGMLGFYFVKARAKDYMAIPSVFGLITGIVKTTFLSLIGKGSSEWKATRMEND